MKSPIPEDERDRLDAVELYDLIERGSDRILNDLTRLAAAICETPISLVTFVREDRQDHMAGTGMELGSTSRDEAFCAHALDLDDLLVVEDATVDERFADNPFVVDDPSIRFYAGAPLRMPGEHTLGTLCVIDKQPRQLNTSRRDALRILRDTIVTHLELKRAREDIKAIRSLLPMCAWCRSIRTPDDRWVPIHEYVSDTQPVSHGICPICSQNLTETSAD